MLFFETFFMKNDKQIAERLTNLVKDKGFSANEFADYCGVSAPNMSGYLNGKRPLGIKIIGKIKEVIPEIDLNWLLYGKSVSDFVNEDAAEYSAKNPVEKYIEDLVKDRYEAVTAKMEKMERQLKQDILDIKSTLDVTDEDSEMIIKLKRIIAKNTQ